MSNRVTKSVYFGLSDEYDIKLFNHALKVNELSGKTRNFSKYIKKLIEIDMNKGSEIAIFNTVDLVDELENEDKEAMSSFL